MGVSVHPATRSRRQSLSAGSVLALALAVVALALPSVGPQRKPRRTAERPEAGLVYTIDLPFEEPDVPAGPNREQFTAYCRLCHSPRLVLTQPRLSEKKWGEVVRKMVTVYGAPIPPDQEAAVIAYLLTVLGPDPAATSDRQRP